MPASSLSPCSHRWPQPAGKRTTLLHLPNNAAALWLPVLLGCPAVALY